MARYRDLRRMVQVTDELVMGAGGEYSDFQAIVEMLEEITCASPPRAPRRALPREPLPTVRPARRMEDVVAEDGCKMSPAACHEFLSRVMYNRRSKGNPLWNSLVHVVMYSHYLLTSLVVRARPSPVCCRSVSPPRLPPSVTTAPRLDLKYPQHSPAPLSWVTLSCTDLRTNFDARCCGRAAL